MDKSNLKVVRMRIKLHRLFENQGTFGSLRVPIVHGGDDYKALLCTCENPWKNNKPFISCIPPGVYPIERFESPKFKYWSYKILNVKGRCGNIFHIGNTEEDTDGCVLLGMRFDKIRTKKTNDKIKNAIIYSNRAFKEFMAYMDGIEKAELEIIDEVIRK